MTTIKATCPTCGEVALTPEDIELRVDRTDAGTSAYSFTCPSCDCLVRKPADERIVRLLISGGVEPLDVEDALVATAGRIVEPRFSGPAFTHDDLLDFHHLLDSDHWFDELVDLVRRENVR